MLRGSAKQFIILQRGLTSWAALKSCFIQKFQIEINSAVFHIQLQKRKRQVGETPRQYVYAMQAIANQDYVEEDSFIQYIIDDILNDEANKQILYNLRTIDEVKKNLKLYDRMREKLGRKKPVGKIDSRTEASKETKFEKEKKDVRQSTMKKARYFACGSSDHAVKECPSKDKEPKCFRCNQFGHIAFKCKNAVK